MIEVGSKVIATGKFECEVVDIIREDGIDWYECKLIGYDLFTRFFERKHLQIVKE